MNSHVRPDTLSALVATYIPYLRRYARALCGNQEIGDTYVRATLECLVEEPALITGTPSTAVSLYRVFHTIWTGINENLGGAEAVDTRQLRLQRRLLSLVPHQRQVLLLTAMEGFSTGEVAEILNLQPADVASLLAEAEAGISSQEAARVMIIEDETIIALDLRALVQEFGHTVTGVARTHAEAVQKAATDNPELILADIQLADGSSGLEAVREILRDLPVPVIFITAYPERLLTGNRPEPTYLITKPFNPQVVQATMAQALLFHRAEPLETAAAV